MNWGEMYLGFVDFLRTHLLDGTFDEEREALLGPQITKLKHYRNPDLSRDGSPLYLVSEAVIDWCVKHKSLLPYPKSHP